MEGAIITDSKQNYLHNSVRKKGYGEDILRVLKRIRSMSGYVSSKHFVAGFIRFKYKILFEHYDIKPVLTLKLKQQILRINARAMNRLLKPYSVR